MLHKRLLATLAAVLSLSFSMAVPAFAQDDGGLRQSDPQAGDLPQPGQPTQPDRRTRRPAPPTPAQNMAAGQAIVTAAGVNCTVTAASVAFETIDTKQPAYEVACSTGPGYIAIASTPPKALDCLELTSTAIVMRERDPAANVGQQCSLPENNNSVAVVAAWATEAGIACTVDQGMLFGLGDADAKLYEVGCADRDGYVIEKAATGWKVSPCWDWSLQTKKCRFSTPAESLAAWKPNLATTAAAACDVSEGRRVGRDGQGRQVYEVKCQSGDGFFIRTTPDFKVAVVQTCAEAANVAGGCKIGLPPEAAAPAAQ